MLVAIKDIKMDDLSFYFTKGESEKDKKCEIGIYRTQSQCALNLTAFFFMINDRERRKE
jgi:hypothetical protein